MIPATFVDSSDWGILEGFTSYTSTVSGKLSVYFLMRVILALTAALFLTNAFRVWESMVLRIGKEKANLTIYVLL
jgi:hypothetical protein